MDELTYYTVIPCAPPWPRGEARIHSGGREVAAVRSEPWPDVLTRPWPDGLKGLPWLPWLLGHKHRTAQSRFVVRGADGRPILRLHEREPIFRPTVGVFDAEDVRVGYCGGAFKGGGDGIAVRDTAHRIVGALAKADGSSIRFIAADKELLGEITGTPAGYAVTAASDRPNARLFLLAATLVLIAWGRLSRP
ncbi:hypothetical protein [Limnoglobus roseus]|uniref:Uncharacterized protein n=1 Tax=Limnoglobus roseus TaxID=2598579 RepID=A0A5C1AP40_9BACT|nr:hypothetical protein [Limnoglobus roseus]QEL20931.1 hypothetical protein PX52LOC_08055 [Limnoglobus roseus]